MGHQITSGDAGPWIDAANYRAWKFQGAIIVAATRYGYQAGTDVAKLVDACDSFDTDEHAAATGEVVDMCDKAIEFLNGLAPAGYYLDINSDQGVFGLWCAADDYTIEYTDGVWRVTGGDGDTHGRLQRVLDHVGEQIGVPVRCLKENGRYRLGIDPHKQQGDS
jgi:hypothetical protein